MRPRSIAPFTVPGPPPHPLLGRFGHVLAMLADPIGAMGRLFAAHGPIAALVAGGGTRFFSPRPDCPGTVFVCGPELARQVTSQADVYHHYPGSGRLYPLDETVPPRLAPLKHWGAGLFALNGEVHQQHRRIMRPVFHRQQVANYLEVVVDQTQAMLDSWQPGHVLDVHAAMVDLTMRIATEVLFGLRAVELARPVGHALQASLLALVHPLTLLLPLDLPGLPYRRFLDQAGRIDTALRQVVGRKRADPSPADDVLARLLRAQDENGARLSEDDLIGHMNLLFAAGHETTANALTWTFFLLSQHPAVLADVYDELDRQLPGGVPTAAQLDELPRLERVLLESMRILPPVPWLPRIAVQPAKLGGHVLPAGTEIIVSIFHTQRLVTRFPEPEAYRPDRWLQLQPDTFEYLVFGGGPHRCLGAAFAMLEVKTILAMVLQRFGLDFDTRRRLHHKVTVTLAPQRGLPMCLHRRDARPGGHSGAVSGRIRELIRLPS